MVTEIAYFLIGLIFGSFATMASWRLLHGGSFLTRSKCPKCKHKLGVKDLFPLFSFIIQNGKCRYCKNKISLRYPATELATGIAFFVIATRFADIPIFCMLLCAMALCLIIMIVTDFEEYIIPDEIQVALTVIGIFYTFYIDYTLMQVIIMPMVCGGIALLLKYGFKFFMKKDGLGMGDVKFFAVAGIYLPPEAVAGFFLVSGLCGILVSLAWKVLKKGDLFPFGPALAIALYIMAVFPDSADIANFLLN